MSSKSTTTTTPAWILNLCTTLGGCNINTLQDLYPGTPAYNARRSLFDRIEAEYPLYLRSLVHQDLLAYNERRSLGKNKTGLVSARNGNRVRRKVFWEEMSCLIVYELDLERVAIPNNLNSLGDALEGHDENQISISMKWTSLEDLAEYTQWIYCPMLSGHSSSTVSSISRVYDIVRC